MAYKKGNRNEITFLPNCIDDYVKENDPVRFYDAFIENINLKNIGIDYDKNLVGNSAYDPKVMLKILIYGYSYGHKSSRGLERALHHNLSFIWLADGITPSYKTISEFRRKNKRALQKILKETVKLCIELNLIDGNILFVDGSKFRASASLNATKNKKRLEESLKKIDERIEKLLRECEKIDKEENGIKSFLEINKELSRIQNKKEKIKEMVEQLNKLNEAEYNTTDPDAKIMHSQEGSHVCYNVQNVVDIKHGLIVNTDVVNDKNDSGQFAKQIDQANEIVNNRCHTACADAGYANTKELKKIDDQGIKVIVPSQRQAKKVADKPFNNSEFNYIKEKDIYICPVGEILEFKHFRNAKKEERVYLLSDSKTCKNCQHYGVCTKSKRGRQINRLKDAETMKKLEQQYLESESQKIYKLRKEKVELPFGSIKHNLNSRSFLLRGFDGVKAEMNILSACYNLTRMINLIGLDKLVQSLSSALITFFNFLEIKLKRTLIYG